MSDFQVHGNGGDSSAASAARKPRTFASVLSALIGIVWAGFSAFCLLGALLQGPPAARIAAAFLFVVGVMLALPWTVAWLRRRAAFFRSTFVPPLGAVLATVVGLIVITSSIPEEQRRAWATERQASEDERANERRERAAERQVADQRREDERRQRVQTQITTMWQEMMRVTQPCDQAAEAASNALGGSDLVASYQAVQGAQDICERAGVDVLQIDAPSDLERRERETFEEAIQACSYAYAGKAVMFDRMLTVIDGDRRPSRVAAVQEAGRISQAQVVQCVLRLHTLAGEQGVELGEPEGSGT